VVQRAFEAPRRVPIGGSGLSKAQGLVCDLVEQDVAMAAADHAQDLFFCICSASARVATSNRPGGEDAGPAA
jgi:hypothetical protein